MSEWDDPEGSRSPVVECGTGLLDVGWEDAQQSEWLAVLFSPISVHIVPIQGSVKIMMYGLECARRIAWVM